MSTRAGVFTCLLTTAASGYVGYHLGRMPYGELPWQTLVPMTRTEVLNKYRNRHSWYECATTEFLFEQRDAAYAHAPTPADEIWEDYVGVPKSVLVRNGIDRILDEHLAEQGVKLVKKGN